MKIHVKEVDPKLKSKKLYTFYVCVFVVLLTWVILTAFKVPFIPNVPAPLWPLLYSLLLIAIPVALLRVAKWPFFGNTKPDEAIKMVLAAVGVAIVLFWVMQDTWQRA